LKQEEALLCEKIDRTVTVELLAPSNSFTTLQLVPACLNPMMDLFNVQKPGAKC
jgi:hypothetical protein